MWLIWALASALFSGITALFAKHCANKIEATVAVALRSTVILSFAWAIVLIGGARQDIGQIEGKVLIFPLLSGITNAFSWLCYFKALSKGSVSHVAAIDKAGITLTILGGWFLLSEAMTLPKAVSVGAVLVGAYLMTEQEDQCNSTIVDTSRLPSIQTTGSFAKPRKVSLKHKNYLFWAILSTILTSATTLLSKAGSERVGSDLGFAIRSGMVFVIVWAVMICQKKAMALELCNRKTILLVLFSGLTTAIAFLCYFRALASPSAQAGIVQPMDKLSVLISVIGARVFFKEKLNKRSAAGLVILVGGILVLLI